MTERRKRDIPVTLERRRRVNPATTDRLYADEETDFMMAMDLYKRACRRPFPTWSEVLEVLRALGYRRVEPPAAMPGLPARTRIPAR